MTEIMKKQMKTKKELFRCGIAGVQYSDYQLCLGLKPGLKLKLVWERSNRYDKMAIRVEYQGVKLGYIPRDPAYQGVLHAHREQGNKVYASLTSVNKTNPTWYMLVLKCEVFEKSVSTKEVEL